MSGSSDSRSKLKQVFSVCCGVVCDRDVLFG